MNTGLVMFPMSLSRFLTLFRTYMYYSHMILIVSGHSTLAFNVIQFICKATAYTFPDCWPEVNMYREGSLTDNLDTVFCFRPSSDKC
jgi:hypothetical protein